MANEGALLIAGIVAISILGSGRRSTTQRTEPPIGVNPMAAIWRSPVETDDGDTYVDPTLISPFIAADSTPVTAAASSDEDIGVNPMAAQYRSPVVVQVDYTEPVAGGNVVLVNPDALPATGSGSLAEQEEKDAPSEIVDDIPAYFDEQEQEEKDAPFQTVDDIRAYFDEQEGIIVQEPEIDVYVAPTPNAGLTISGYWPAEDPGDQWYWDQMEVVGGYEEYPGPIGLNPMAAQYRGTGG